MKILLYIGVPKIAMAGGSERVFCELSNALTARGHEVYAVCHSFQERPYYPLDDQVHFVNFDGSGCRKVFQPLSWIKGIRSFLPTVCNEALERYEFRSRGEPLMKLIRSFQPDIVIPYFVNDYLMLPQPLGIPVLLLHRSSGGRFFKYADTPKKIEKVNTCSHLQVLQPSFASEIQKIFYGEIHVMPNVAPLLEGQDLADLTAEKTPRTIVMVSRVHREKQQHLLIQAFGHLAKDYPDWQVEMYGAATKQSYFRKLKNMIASFGLAGQVELKGLTNRPLDVLRRADIFAFPSVYPEGFSNALAEAMTVGLPCVGLKITPSVNEMIVDGVNGFLTENTPENFAAKLKLLMDDQNLRIQMGKTGHAMMKPYAPEKIWDQWEELITKIVRQYRQQHPHQQRKAA